MYNFVQKTLCKRPTLVAHLTNFSFECFYKILTEDASQRLLYHSAKKSKMTKNSNQGGPALTLCEAIDRFQSIATWVYSYLIFW